MAAVWEFKTIFPPQRKHCLFFLSKMNHKHSNILPGYSFQLQIILSGRNNLPKVCLQIQQSKLYRNPAFWVGNGSSTSRGHTKYTMFLASATTLFPNSPHNFWIILFQSFIHLSCHLPLQFSHFLRFYKAFHIHSVLKNPCVSAGDMNLIPGLGGPLEEGTGNPLQYSCLGNPRDRGAWHATVRGVSKSRTWLSTHTCTGFYTKLFVSGRLSLGVSSTHLKISSTHLSLASSDMTATAISVHVVQESALSSTFISLYIISIYLLSICLCLGIVWPLQADSW